MQNDAAGGVLASFAQGGAYNRRTPLGVRT